MLKITNIEVMNFKNAIRGARNPMNSWARSDSYFDENGNFVLGENDLSLAVRLRKAGSDHRKFLRQVLVSMDITAPMYWWKEYDTYKVATVANSTSTMHRITSAPFDLSQFSVDKMDDDTLGTMKMIIDRLEELRQKFLSTKDKQYWYDIIQLLPSSYDQMRTCTMNYETLINIYHARKNHKLDEWHVFCDTISTLPYARELIICSDEPEHDS